MATRSRDTFKKRQKELLRMEKQRDKVAKRLAKKAKGPDGDATPESEESTSTSDNQAEHQAG